MKNILIAGGSGLVGSHLIPILQKKGYSVAVLSRKAGRPTDNFRTFLWNLATAEIDSEAVAWSDVIINLAGAGIADGRWTAARKKELIDSRVQTAQLLKREILKNEKRPTVYLAASAIGFYGNRGDEILTEKSEAGAGFLPECSILWEKATDEIAQIDGVRTIKMRIGVVLSTLGGALPELMMPIKMGAATYFADGKAWYAWIHIEDLCRQFLFVLENEKCAGAFNCVAPNALIIKDLSKKIAHGMGRGWAILMPVPSFALRIIFGEMADVVLNSVRVSTQKMLDAAFQFQFPEAETAVRDLIFRKI